MQVIKSKAELRNSIKKLRAAGKTISFVPTMGALHHGHLSLIDVAKFKSDIVVSSIFVNPKQFAPHEDFNKYPRQEESDLAQLAKADVDIVYLPTITEMYQPQTTISIAVGDIGKKFEGIVRPHFFDGVALVVTKLFLQVTPDIAVFGEKDYQQLLIVKKLVHELDIPVEIIGAPICREADGLAMSSRNVYLSAASRQIAPTLYKTLNSIKAKLSSGETAVTILESGRQQLLASGFEHVDYVSLCDAHTLEPLQIANKSARIIAAATIQGVRLLDNIAA